MSTAGDPSSEKAGKYFLISLKMVPGRTLSPEVLGFHAAHLSELDRSERLVLAGAVPEHLGGLIVLRVASLADAKAVAEEDPLVRGGYQTYELGTWLMSNRHNGYRPDLQEEHQK
jgi:uncharacterized protein YciI